MPPPRRVTFPCAARSRGCWIGAPHAGFALSLLLLLVLAACSANDGVVQPAAVEASIAQPGGPLLLDVRRPEEFAEGFVPGATNIPLDELGRRMVEIEAYAERGVVVYCESGRRAGLAISVLEEAGFQNLAILEGSMQRWRAESRPIARPASALRAWPGLPGAARFKDSG